MGRARAIRRSAGAGTCRDEVLVAVAAVGLCHTDSYPVEMVEARDVSNVALFLSSDEARYVTGLEFTVDGGNTIR